MNNDYVQWQGILATIRINKCVKNSLENIRLAASIIVQNAFCHSVLYQIYTHATTKTSAAQLIKLFGLFSMGPVFDSHVASLDVEQVSVD